MLLLVLRVLYCDLVSALNSSVHMQVSTSPNSAKSVNVDLRLHYARLFAVHSYDRDSKELWDAVRSNIPRFTFLSFKWLTPTAVLSAAITAP